MLRLFVAVLLPDSLKQAIAEAIEPLRKDRAARQADWGRQGITQLVYTIVFQ